MFTEHSIFITVILLISVIFKLNGIYSSLVVFTTIINLLVTSLYWVLQLDPTNLLSAEQIQQNLVCPLYLDLIHHLLPLLAVIFVIKMHGITVERRRDHSFFLCYSIIYYLLTISARKYRGSMQYVFLEKMNNLEILKMFIKIILMSHLIIEIIKRYISE
ncbi:hypothetical protein NUSPORA_02693 [Nucleospora cyclopteri]